MALPPRGAATRFVLWPLPDLRAMPADAPGHLDDAHPIPSPEQRGYERGLADGQREAREEAQRALGAAHEGAKLLARGLQQAQATWAETLDANLQALAVAVARHLVEREVAGAPEIVAELVGRAVALVEPAGPIVVRVHPADVAAVETVQHAPDRAADAPTFSVQADPTIARGGCVIETPGRLVDGRIETALAALYQRMRDG